jgi:hypothetical protein
MKVEKYIKVETMPQELEVIFPIQKLFEEYKTYTE